jgi:tetratricopeptide (TPR) repeat protein
MEQQGKAKIEGREGAKRAYFLFEAEAGSNRTLLYRAKIGRARCDAVLGDHDKALKDLEALRKELEDPKNKDASAALAEVYVSLGDVYFLKLDYRQARWYYLTVIVRHANDRAMTARAHYKAGLCYEKLVEKARERQGLPRALRHYEIVVKEFQGCVEHKAAKERLESLKGRLGA